MSTPPKVSNRSKVMKARWKRIREQKANRRVLLAVVLGMLIAMLLLQHYR